MSAPLVIATLVATLLVFASIALAAVAENVRRDRFDRATFHLLISFALLTVAALVHVTHAAEQPAPPPPPRAILIGAIGQ